MPEKSAAAVQPAASRPLVKTGALENLADRVGRIREAIAQRAYELFEREGRADGNDVRHWLEAESELLQPVPVNVEESNSEFVVRAEVPGFTANELEVNGEARRVTIAGKHQSKKENKKGESVYTEESSEEIFRSVDLASEVNTAKISATLKDGTLTIQLPKAGTQKPGPSAQQAA